MDPALKQRLIGAAVLIVLAVIFVPMLLDGDREPATETVDLSVPNAPATEFETRVVPLDPASPTPRAAPAPAPADPVASVDADAPPRTDALEEVAAPAATPAPTAAAPAATPTPAAAAPSPSPSPSPAAAPGRGRYVVSFGTYGKRENADALVAALRKATVQAYAEAVDLDGKPGLRVRSGPYVDRTQAEKARLLAKQARPDVPGTLVEVDDTPASGDAPAPPAGTVTGWAVQVGAYKNDADAKAQRDKLRGAGFAAYVESIRAESGTLYRVRVGPETERAGAERLRDALRTRLGLAGQVVTHP